MGGNVGEGCGQPVNSQPCDAAVQGERRGEKYVGGVYSFLLPSPEETAASGTSPVSSDGARFPQTSSEKKKKRNS